MADVISRSGLDTGSTPTGPGLIPVQYANEIIQSATANSVALSTFRTMRMPTGTTSLPVMSALPNVGFVNETPLHGSGYEDTVKPVTDATWDNVVLTAEELAAIVVIPEAVVEDSSINLWNEITPRLGEAIAVKIDETVFFGGSGSHGKPATFAYGLYEQANDVSNVANSGDLIADFNSAFGMVEDSGYDVSTVYASRAIKTSLRGAVGEDGHPIYLESFRGDGQTDQIYGASINYVAASAWDNTLAKAIVCDPRHAILGIRTDMQTKILDQASIDVSAAKDGSQVVNLAQQDLIAMRVRFRFGFAVANPVTALGSGTPFAVVAPPAGP